MENIKLEDFELAKIEIQDPFEEYEKTLPCYDKNKENEYFEEAVYLNQQGLGFSVRLKRRGTYEHDDTTGRELPSFYVEGVYRQNKAGLKLGMIGKELPDYIQDNDEYTGFMLDLEKRALGDVREAYVKRDEEKRIAEKAAKEKKAKEDAFDALEYIKSLKGNSK